MGNAQYPAEAEYQLGIWDLNDLTALSGGGTVLISDLKGGKSSLPHVFDEIRAQYDVTLTPSTLVDGQRSTIRVRVNRPGLIARARGSYIP